MAKLGLAPKKLSSENSSVALAKTSDSVQNSVGEDAKRLAAAALAAVKDAAANAQVGKGKIQVSLSFLLLNDIVLVPSRLGDTSYHNLSLHYYFKIRNSKFKW